MRPSAMALAVFAMPVAALAAKLPALAKDDLVMDQIRRVADRNRACAGDAVAIADCLKTRYATRPSNLRVFDKGTPMPG